MAISIVQSKSTGSTFTGTTGGTNSFASTPSLSNKLVIGIWGWSNIGTTWTISDNQTGNVYNLRASVIPNSGDNPTCLMYDCTPTSSSGTFTVKIVNTDTVANNSDAYINLFEISGLGAFDQTASQARINSSSYGCGPTGTLANAAEFAMALTSSDAQQTSVPGGAWTNLKLDNNGIVQGGSCDYQITAATTALSTTYTNSGANFVTALIGTWQASAGGGGGSRRKILTC